MGPCERFLGTFIEIEIDDVIVMINGFWIFQTNLRMVLLTIEMKNNRNNFHYHFFWWFKNIIDYWGYFITGGLSLNLNDT